MGWVISVTPRPCSTPGKDPRYPFDRRLVEPQSWSGNRGYRKNHLPLSVIEPRSSSSYTLYWPSYPNSWCAWFFQKKVHGILTHVVLWKNRLFLWALTWGFEGDPQDVYVEVKYGMRWHRKLVLGIFIILYITLLSNNRDTACLSYTLLWTAAVRSLKVPDDGATHCVK
jgi:hypothetical protein